MSIPISNSDFSLVDVPSAFFCDNPKSKIARNNIIKNQYKVSECKQGDLEQIFFSNNNIGLINKQLILSIYKKTNGEIKINEQSKQNLLIVMKYIYVEYAKHLPYNIVEQIKELNCRVVGEISPQIISEVNQRIEYLNHINNPRELIPLPSSDNIKNKSLQSTSTIFN